MIRILTAAAMAALLASPALAQSSSSPSEQPSQLQEQDTTGSGRLESSPGAQSQVPIDCLPNDVRPECQTAQMPSDESTGSGSATTDPRGGTSLDPQQRDPATGASPGGSGSWGGPGGAEPTR